MKNKMLLMAIVSGVVVASCNKTYVCKDQAGIVTAEVKARSQSKANSLCQGNNPNPVTAIQK
ncbi:MAG: hypothetical protein V4635_12180 [Bacteroidota bacterium]